jgi:hypothetical protein
MNDGKPIHGDSETPRTGELQHARASELERIISGDSDFSATRVFAQAFMRRCRQVCRIEHGERGPIGSGCLVGPDLVLTNWHVKDGIGDAGSALVRFDYATEGATETVGRTCGLAARDWLVDESLPSPRELGRAEGPDEPTPDLLDFALLRLNESVGLDVSDSEQRGWVTEFSSDCALTTKLMVLQHPRGRPMQLSMGQVTRVNDAGTRIYYSASTEPGSSGGPCFDQQMRLIAVHHAGPEGENNRGVPIDLIVGAAPAVFSEMEEDPSLPGEQRLSLSVTILMQFDQFDLQDELRHKIIYHRIKHHLEKGIVLTRSLNSVAGRRKFKFEVNLASLAIEHEEKVLQEIAEANVVVAVLTRPSPTLAYQIGYRDTIRSETIVLHSRQVRGRLEELLPVHVPRSVCIPFDEPVPGGPEEHYIHDPIYSKFFEHQLDISFRDHTLHKEVERAVIKYDQYLHRRLAFALDHLNYGDVRHAQPVFKHVGKLRLPEDFLQHWFAYLPTSLLRICWKGKTGPGNDYRPEDIEGDVVVCDGNEGFREIFAVSASDFGGNESRVYSYTQLMSNIRKYVCPLHLEKFDEEQEELRHELIFGETRIVAKVPLRFMDESDAADHLHQSTGMRGRVFLPCLMAKNTIGQVDHFHATYMIVSFVEQFWTVTQTPAR